jgi:hypothetical protein
MVRTATKINLQVLPGSTWTEHWSCARPSNRGKDGEETYGALLWLTSDYEHRLGRLQLCTYTWLIRELPGWGCSRTDPIQLEQYTLR